MRCVVARGTDPLPFFAEYAYYLWGEINYDSDGNCARPTDRAWTELHLANRRTRERLRVRCDGNEVSFEGPSAELAAALTAVRTGGVAQLPEDHARRIAEADRVREQFLDPNLVAFDTFGWWGGWKWVGEFATDMTTGLRIVLQCVHEKRLVDPGILAWLREWNVEPPKPFHRDGVAFAVEFLGRLAQR
jgi:hypothetical protein